MGVSGKAMWCLIDTDGADVLKLILFAEYNFEGPAVAWPLKSRDI
jgi:hypothetical protein